MISTLRQKYTHLYGKNVNVEEMDNRFLSLTSDHKALFGKDNPMIFSASGRTEIAGNHTDHNLGLVPLTEGLSVLRIGGNHIIE